MAEPASYVQPQAYDADGKPLDPESLTEAAAKGQAFFKQGAKVYAKNAQGQLVTLAPEDVSHPGYTVLTPAQVEQAQAQKQYGEGLGNVAKAGAAGAARGLTLGASDALLAGIGGDDTRKALQGLRQANPITSTVSEIAGAVAPVALSGGAGAAAEAGALAKAGSAAAGVVRTAGVLPRAAAAAGSLVERGVARGLASFGYEGTSLAGRAAAGAAKLGAAGAAEGAIYGGAAAANDAVLNGDEITAEKIVAGMGHGALFGGAVGGVLGGAAPLVSAGVSKLIPRPEALTKLAQEQALKSVARGTDIRRIAGRAVGEAAEQRLAATADDLLSYKFQTGALKGERVFLPGRNTEELLERISVAKNEAGARLGGLKDELSEHMAAAGASPDVGEFLRRVKEQVTDPLLKSNVPGVRANVRAVDRQLSIVRGNYEAALQAGNPEQMAMSFRQLDDLRGELRSVFQPKAPSSGGMPPQPPKSAQYLEKTERILSDYLKESAGDFLAKAGDNPNAYNELNRQFSSFAKLEQIAGKNANQQLGNRMISPSDHALGLASFMGALATGNVGALGAMGTGAAASMANKLLRERGNSLVADMARRAAEMDTSIDRVAQALAGKTERAKAPALAASLQGENLRETYERTANRVRELAVPQAAQAHISSLVPEVAAQYPLAGAAISSKLLAIYQQLSARLPASHADTGTTLTPLAIRQRATPVAMRKFMSEVRGALEPEKVIDDLGRGVVDRDALAVLKEAHPLTFAQLRNRVADFVQENQEELPYKRRLMLSLTFDFAGDSSLEPQRMAGLQQVAQSLSLQEQAQDAKMMAPKKTSERKSTLASTLSTPSQSAFGGT